MWMAINAVLIPLVSWWLKRSGMKEEEAVQFLASVKLLQKASDSLTQAPLDAEASREKLNRMELEKPKEGA